ncbi:MAG: hypothetical protein ACPIOQ_81580, partial [Promethearchaeia archaeon]
MPFRGILCREPKDTQSRLLTADEHAAAEPHTGRQVASAQAPTRSPRSAVAELDPPASSGVPATTVRGVPRFASPRLARSHARTHERNETDFPVGLPPQPPIHPSHPSIYPAQKL